VPVHPEKLTNIVCSIILSTLIQKQVAFEV